MKKWELILTWTLYVPDFALKQNAPWGSVSVVASDALSLSSGIMVTLYLLICLTVSGNRVTEMRPHTLNLLNKSQSSEQITWFDKDHKKNTCFRTSLKSKPHYVEVITPELKGFLLKERFASNLLHSSWPPTQSLQVFFHFFFFPCAKQAVDLGLSTLRF